MKHPDISRRDSLKLLGAGSLVFSSPLASALIDRAEQKVPLILVGNTAILDYLSTAHVNQAVKLDFLVIDISKPESFTAITELPNETLIVGMASDAEKVLLESTLQNHRAVLNTTGYFSPRNDQESDVHQLLNHTLQAATIKQNEFTSGAGTSGSLSAFYAYL